MKGDTFLKDDPNKKYLRVIISDPDPDPDNNVLVVSLNSYDKTKNYHDSTCIINKGEHSFVVRDSFINYFKSEEYNYFKINRELHIEKLIPKENINNLILKRIQRGAMKSKLFPVKHKKYLKYF